MLTVWIFITRIYHMPFLLSKNNLCMWISGYLFMQNDVFLKVPYILWVWDFVDLYLTHLGTRIWNPSIHIYSKRWFFWTPKNWCTPQGQGKKTFSSTLNITILQMVRNESVSFGGHVDVQVSYKILWSKIPKKAPILHNLPCLQEGLFWGNFGLNAAIDV
jgi:hypothetical protein